MKRFGYVHDPIFLIAAGGYAINRCVLKPAIASPFLHGYFNDLLLIPAALPVVLWVQRLVGLRRNDLAPSWAEVGLHLVLWSFICEFVGPRFLHLGTGDIGDVVAYCVGGLFAALCWNRSMYRVAIRVP